jgi:hypothetical protein
MARSRRVPFSPNETRERREQKTVNARRKAVAFEDEDELRRLSPALAFARDHGVFDPDDLKRPEKDWNSGKWGRGGKGQSTLDIAGNWNRSMRASESVVAAEGKSDRLLPEKMEVIWHWRHVPRPVDIPHWRNELIDAWAPGGGVLSSLSLKVFDESGGFHVFVPWWEYEQFTKASLWFVGAEMCDLLDRVAPSLPDTILAADVIPDRSGFVVFEKPLKSLDSISGDVSLMTGAMLWGPAQWSNGDKSYPIIGITVYAPIITGKPPYVMPLGNLIWPFGQGTDDPQDLEGNYASDLLDPSQCASMAEDRRRLMALWLISQQPAVAQARDQTVSMTPRNKSARRRMKAPLPDVRVRVVYLRTLPHPDHEPEPGPGRQYSHRWVVKEHWRNQAFGPKHGLRRPVLVRSHVRGPENAPFLGGSVVKFWKR